MKINLASQLHIPSPDQNLPDYIVDRFGSREWRKRKLPLSDDVVAYLMKLRMAQHLNYDDWCVREYYGNSGCRLEMFLFTGN